MVRGKSTFLKCLAVCSTSLYEPTAVHSKAAEKLLRSMDPSYMTSFSGIFLQRTLGGNKCDGQVKIDQSKEGKIRVSMLQPLSMQGITSLDDGRTWSTYFPDDKQIVIQQSPRARAQDPKQRIELASKNYTFRFESGETIAGRRTNTVVAEPVFEGMPTRMYSLDSETSYMLRLETVDFRGKRSTHFDTKAIQFDARLNDKLFELRPVGDFRQVKLDAPERIRSMAQAHERLGFRPVLPEELPAGFVINDRGIAGKDNTEFVVIRITDGLVTATVYQWNGRKPDQPWPTSRRDREVDGIKMRLIGDLPDGVMSRVLDAFIRKAVKNIGASLETINATIVFELPREDEPVFFFISQQP